MGFLSQKPGFPPCRDSAVFGALFDTNDAVPEAPKCSIMLPPHTGVFYGSDDIDDDGACVGVVMSGSLD
jgi:hypothetical protein